MKDIFLDLLKPCCGFSFLELRRFINAIKFNSEENRQIILGGIQTNGNLSQAAWELFIRTVIYNENLNAELLGEWIGECYKLNCEQLKQLIEGVEYNISQFDITADWENATDFEGNPFPVTDEKSFKNWLSSQKRYYGNNDDVEKTKIKDIYIENFSLISGRITCDLYANANYSFLDLSNIEVSKVTNLGGIVNLFALSIYNSNIPNEAINDLFDNYDFFVLRYLYLNNNQLTEFNPSFPLPNLNTLYLSYNQLTEFNPSFPLPNLNTLYLDNNQLTEFNPSFPLPNLNTLYLYNNQLTEFNPSFPLPNLNTLYLYNNQLTEFNPSFPLPNLNTLYLSYNQLTEFNPSFPLPNLNALYLYNNQLTEFNPSFPLPNLNTLYLYNNQLTEFNPSFPLPNLNTLYLDNNQLTEFNHINWINFVKNNGYAVFSNNPVSVNETPTKTALLAKNWLVIA